MDMNFIDCLQQFDVNGFSYNDVAPELKELMEKMNILVQQKKEEWENNLLSAKDELQNMRTLLKNKQQEIEDLTERLQNNDKRATKQFENEINGLKSQLYKLRETHQQMAERCSKKSKLNSSREKELHAEIDELQAELNEKRFEVAKYNKEFSEIEVSKRLLKNKIECMERQKQTLHNNYEKCQQDLSQSRKELQHLKSYKEKLESESQTLIRKLEYELGSDKDLIQQQENEIKTLHKRLREAENACYNIKSKHKTYVKEINKSDESQLQMKALEEENLKLKEFLEIRDEEIKILKERIIELSDENTEIISKIKNKENQLHDIENRKRGISEKMNYEKKITQLEESLSNVKISEASMKEQMLFLEGQLNRSKNGSECLAARLLNRSDNLQIGILNQEIQAMNDKLKSMETSHSTQLEYIKMEVNKLMKSWNQKKPSENSINNEVNQISKACADIELRLDEEAKKRDLLNQELQSAVRDLQSALKKQNKSGRKTSDNSLNEVERSLIEFKQGYESTHKALTKENQQLHNQISTLKMLERMKEGDKSEKQVESSQRRSIEDDDLPLFVTNTSSNDNMMLRHLRTPTPTREFLESIGFHDNVDKSMQLDVSARYDEDQDFIRKYLMEDRIRTNDLENNIKRNIEDLKSTMNSTIQRYFGET